jgi:hypothetical protein
MEWNKQTGTLNSHTLIRHQKYKERVTPVQQVGVEKSP